MVKTLSFFATLLLLNFGLSAQNLINNQQLFENNWDAKWVSHPECTGAQQGVYLFKKELSVQKIPEKFVIHISADNRYKLYVNKKLVCLGPALGDVRKWRYETIDIAPYLSKGINAICVKVWNFGTVRPVAFNSSKTGLIIQGNSKESNVLNTNSQWKVIKDTSYQFKKIENIKYYYVTGPAELFNGFNHYWKWQEPGFDSPLWKNAVEGENGQSLKSIGKYGELPEKCLYPRDIAGLEYTKQEFQSVRKVNGMSKADANKLIGEQSSLIIPKNSKVSILVDNGVLTNAYPRLNYSKGKNSVIQLTYAESLFYTDTTDGEEVIGSKKGNRNEIEGKKINGNFDLITCDGGQNRSFEPLWWRCFRYVQLNIQTSNEDLYLNNFHSLFVAYPLKEKAVFNVNNPMFNKIWKVGWRTQRLCASESFYDCPYYEQLQYTGDTRVQSLTTYYVSGDTLLWRKAINDFYDSKNSTGITQSRYPCNSPQFIPTFSLIWITMLHDYVMHCGDHEFIRTKLPAVLDILQWFEHRFDENGLPGKLEFWNFVDWVESEGWDSGIPPLMDGKSSSIIAMQYLYTLKKADFLFEYFGMNDQRKHYNELGKKIKDAVQQTCWDKSRNLFADTPERKHFSQHANVLAILADVAPAAQQTEMINTIFQDSTLAQCSYYFTFYLTKALKKANRADLYFKVLLQWEEMLKMGLTTFPEKPPAITRSDCHAWSASPLYFMLSLVCGIEPTAPGFKELKMAPEFGKLNQIEAVFPHYNGDIKINLKKKGRHLTGEIFVPDDIQMRLEWNNKSHLLSKGKNSIEIE
jgi:alpha-L-rhamnosidase